MHARWSLVMVGSVVWAMGAATVGCKGGSGGGSGGSAGGGRYGGGAAGAPDPKVEAILRGLERGAGGCGFGAVKREIRAVRMTGKDTAVAKVMEHGECQNTGPHTFEVTLAGGDVKTRSTSHDAEVDLREFADGTLVVKGKLLHTMTQKPLTVGEVTVDCQGQRATVKPGADGAWEARGLPRPKKGATIRCVVMLLGDALPLQMAQPFYLWPGDTASAPDLKGVPTPPEALARPHGDTYDVVGLTVEICPLCTVTGSGQCLFDDPELLRGVDDAALAALPSVQLGEWIIYPENLTKYDLFEYRPAKKRGPPAGYYAFQHVMPDGSRHMPPVLRAQAMGSGRRMAMVDKGDTLTDIDDLVVLWEPEANASDQSCRQAMIFKLGAGKRLGRMTAKAGAPDAPAPDAPAPEAADDPAPKAEPAPAPPAGAVDSVF